MVVKIYISGISGNKEVKKRQQRVLMILDSKNVEYETIDITEPGKELEKEFMQTNGIARESKYPLPPQIFNEEEYCGDYEDFDLANETDELEEFLRVAPPASATETALDSNQSKNIQENGNTTSREPSTDKDATAVQAESTEERTTLPNESVEPAESKPVEHDGGTNIATDEVAEHPKDNVEKNEEKSDNQEKEE
ncbi:SH3 domain-binding glutamic acid-rich protein homolog isoform X1 [Colletes latitarsis]|uniref:SH3 domain-binding glutamic acid-rich protein homolog isoform X1 n=2 Tax=Colletes latitarsis TaxID=2605962 RepID=UPI004035EFF2